MAGFLTIGFWNVAKVRAKGKEGKWKKVFEEWITGKNMVGILKTWMVKKELGEVNGWLPRGCGKEGRAKGDMNVSWREDKKRDKVKIMEGCEGLVWMKCQQGGYRMDMGWYTSKIGEK